jgi:hypothetical protein
VKKVVRCLKKWGMISMIIGVNDFAS